MPTPVLANTLAHRAPAAPERSEASPEFRIVGSVVGDGTYRNLAKNMPQLKKDGYGAIAVDYPQSTIDEMRRTSGAYLGPDARQFEQLANNTTTSGGRPPSGFHREFAALSDAAKEHGIELVGIGAPLDDFERAFGKAGFKDASDRMGARTIGSDNQGLAERLEAVGQQHGKVLAVVDPIHTGVNGGGENMGIDALLREKYDARSLDVFTEDSLEATKAAKNEIGANPELADKAGLLPSFNGSNLGGDPSLANADVTAIAESPRELGRALSKLDNTDMDRISQVRERFASAMTDIGNGNDTAVARNTPSPTQNGPEL